MEKITTIFNSEDKTEVKNAFKTIIQEQFKKQLEEMDVYLFDPRSVEELIDDAFGEVVNEAKAEFKKNLKEKLIDSIDLEKIVAKFNE